MLNNNAPSSLLPIGIISLVMLLLVPFPDRLALSASSAVYSHFLYPFAHASFFHYIINVWCLITLANVFSIPRFLVAYAAAVALGFVPSILPACRPVLGFSVVVFYFYGYIARHLWRHSMSSLLSMIPMFVFGFYFPHIAAGLHLTAFAVGFTVWHIQVAFYRIWHFVFQ